MKRVYLAHDSRLARDVAYAVVKTEGMDEKSRERVAREAQAMAKLGDHPHVVSVYDTGEEEGNPYIISQYLEGGSVEELLDVTAPLPIPRVLLIAEEICDALRYAHEHDIIHRDLKPGNVWLAADGSVRLGDFGLAVALDRSRLTAEGSMLGTVAYMPPEQAEGKPADQRSDLYSLGAILYEMVTGRPPFTAETAAGVLSQHLHATPQPPSSLSRMVPPALDELILRLLSKDPSLRPASAAEVAAALREISPREVRSSIEQVALSVAQRQPDLALHAAQDGTVTLMFTDIESSTPLAEKLGDRKWLEVLRAHDELIRAQAEIHRGAVVDTAGDGFLIAFSSARGGVRCAIAIQRALGAEPSEGNGPVRVRIGLHTGEAIKEAEKFIGRHVHLAARVASQAQGGQIIASSLTQELVAGEEFSFGPPSEVTLKGFSGTYRLVPVLWED